MGYRPSGFRWTDAEGEHEFSLAYPLRDPRPRTFRPSWIQDNIVGSPASNRTGDGVVDVEAVARFIRMPDGFAFLGMLDNQIGGLVTYYEERGGLEIEFPAVLLAVSPGGSERVGVAPDPDRHGYGEYSATIVLRFSDHDTAAGLYAYKGGDYEPLAWGQVSYAHTGAGVFFRPQPISFTQGAEVAANMFPSFAAAVAALGSNHARLVLNPGYVGTLTGNLVIPENITLVPRGGIIEVGNYQLTVNDMDDPESIQVFSVGADGLVRMAEGLFPLLNSAWFGSVGDGDEDRAAQNRKAIQDALNTSIYGGARVPVRVPAGVYPTDRTIHLGYGVGEFHSVILEGDAAKYAQVDVMGGTRIRPLHVNAPAFNLQGMRLAQIRSLSVEGRNTNYIASNNLGGATPTPGIDDTVIGNWTDPSIPEMTTGRYNPYAAITVDAYAGTEPGVPYPEVYYPAFLGSGIPQYGKSFSSLSKFSDLDLRGFVVAVCVQPSGADGNGDFTTLRDVQINQCAYGISVCNTQSRDVQLLRVWMGRVHTALTNNTHGAQAGKFDGAIIDLGLGNCIQLFNFGTTAIAGPLHFESFYSERLWRIGTYSGTTSIERAISFESSVFGFHSQAENDFRRGVPAHVIGSVQLSVGIQLTFANCNFANYPFALGFYERSYRVQFIGCRFASAGTISALEPWERLAFQGTCAGIVLHAWGSTALAEVKPYTIDWAGFLNIDTPSTGSTRIVDGVYASNRSLPIPLYAKYTAPSSLIPGDQIPLPVRAFTIAKSSLSSCSLTDGVLEIQLSSLPDAVALRRGPAQGDVILDEATGTAFWIYYRSGTTIRAQIKTNFRKVSGVTTPIVSFSTTTGNLLFGNTRFFTPLLPLFGEITASSAVITDAGTSEGVSDFIDAQIQVNDALFIDSSRDAFWHRDRTRVTARDEDVGTITLSDVADRDAEHKRLPLWIRSAPSNP